jgi:CRP-like cAMP-binding protein
MPAPLAAVSSPAARLQWLSECALFAGVPAERIAALSPHFQLRALPEGVMILMEAQSSPVLNLIVSGTVKATLSRRERVTLLNIAGPGDVLGELSLIDGGGHSADIVTLEETTLLWIDQAYFQDQLLQCPPLCLNLAKTVTRRLRLASARIEALSTLNVQGRVAYQLLQFAREYGADAPRGTVIPLCLTQSDLADLTGATRTRVNQAIAAMRTSNLISVAKNHHITLLDPVLLERRYIV